MRTSTVGAAMLRMALPKVCPMNSGGSPTSTPGATTSTFPFAASSGSRRAASRTTTTPLPSGTLPWDIAARSRKTPRTRATASSSCASCNAPVARASLIACLHSASSAGPSAFRCSMWQPCCSAATAACAGSGSIARLGDTRDDVGLIAANTASGSGTPSGATTPAETPPNWIPSMAAARQAAAFSGSALNERASVSSIPCSGVSVNAGARSRWVP